MNSRKLITSFAAIALLGGLGIGIARAEEEDDKAEQAKLAAEAKITKEQAQATVLKEVPNGTVKEADLEKEDGALIWSFELTTPGTTDLTEVKVDAKTGKVTGVGHEKADSEKKDGKDEKDDDEADQAKLAAEAKVTKEQAQATALKEVPNGTVKKAELEEEDGALIWSFDLTTPDTTDITEVKVDAKTGKMAGVEHEKADEEKDGKGEKEDDDKD